MTGRAGLLIDDRGEVWADDCPVLMHRLGRKEPDFDLVGYAVRNLGFIHLLPNGANLRVSAREKLFSPEALITALYWIVDCRPQRIMLAVFTGETWTYKIFPNIGLFTAYAERMAAGEPTVPGRLFAFKQDAKVLRCRDFAPVRPVLAHWRAARGCMDEDFSKIFRGKFLQQRGVLVRRISPSAGFTIEHFGVGIRTMLPCEALRMVGREVGDAPDAEYSKWVADSFAEAAADERPRIETVRARINISGGAAIDASYHRVLLPWRRGTDTMVLGMSILRERSLVA